MPLTAAAAQVIYALSRTVYTVRQWVAVEGDAACGRRYGVTPEFQLNN